MEPEVRPRGRPGAARRPRRRARRPDRAGGGGVRRRPAGHRRPAAPRRSSRPTAAGTPTGTDRWLRARDVDLLPPRPPRLAGPSRPAGPVRHRHTGRAGAERGRRPGVRPRRRAPRPPRRRRSRSTSSWRRAPARSSGAQFAMGLDPDRIIEVDQRGVRWTAPEAARRRPAVHLAVRVGHGSTPCSTSSSATCRFEDLWLQFACTTTDLTSAQPAAPSPGPAAAVHPGELLAPDGVPARHPRGPPPRRRRHRQQPPRRPAARRWPTSGLLIAVNVTNAFYDADEAYNYEDSLSLGRVLNGRLNPFAERLVAPGMLDVLMRSLEIGSKSVEPAQIAKADVYIRPDVSRFGYTDIGRPRRDRGHRPAGGRGTSRRAGRARGSRSPEPASCREIRPSGAGSAADGQRVPASVRQVSAEASAEAASSAGEASSSAAS